MIKLENIAKKYGEQTVLENISLTVSGGEQIALIGASGRGKTTLLRIIAGFEKTDGGALKCDGIIAYMFQEARLLPWKNARENVLAVLKKENAALADKYLDAVGLADDKDKMPSSLSGGMAQRVAFARFLAYAEATDADILLLDEPFSALDSDTANEMIALLDKFAKNKTLILVTHDETQAEKLGARTVEI